jgi:hypothetical protein
MPTEFRAFEVLRRHGLPFVIIGGHAVNFHGYVRGTDDADVVWLRSPESEAALAAALAELDAQYIGNDIDPATGIERGHPVSPTYVSTHHLMMLWTREGFLDLFDFPPGEPLVDPQQVYDTAITHNGMRFVSLEWLRRMKRTAGRPKDLLDLEELEKLHGPPPDG